MKFISNSYGTLTLEQVFDVIKWRVGIDAEFDIAVGIDTQRIGPNLKVISSIVVHQKSRAGFFFRSKHLISAPKTLTEKIWYEAMQLVELTEKVENFVIEAELYNVTVEPHLDVGNVGGTKSLVRGVVGYVKGAGFDNVKIKPHAYAASCVSDKYSKGGTRRDRRPVK